MREQGGENRKRRMRIGIFQDAFFPMIDGVVEVVDHYAREMQRYADVTVVVPETGWPRYVRTRTGIPGSFRLSGYIRSLV